MQSSPSPISISVLGPPQVAVGGDPLPPSTWGSITARMLFLYLLESPGGATSDELLAAFWPTSSEPRARSALTTTVHRARRAVGHHVLRRGDGCFEIVLPPGSEYDLARFRSLTASCSGTAGEQKTRSLAAALALVRGEYLQGLAFDWVIDRRWIIEAEILEATLALADAYADQRLWQRAIRRYRAALKRDELREDAHRGLMRCYAGQGNRAMALRQFRALAQLLAREVGADPDPRTVALYQVIRAAK